jgi:hypothetical protein
MSNELTQIPLPSALSEVRTLLFERGNSGGHGFSRGFLLPRHNQEGQSAVYADQDDDNDEDGWEFLIRAILVIRGKNSFLNHFRAKRHSTEGRSKYLRYHG